MAFKILVISNYRSINSTRPEAEMFIGLARRGVQVDIMTYPDAESNIRRFREAGIRVIPWHPRSKWSFGAIARIRRVLKEGNYDFMHLYNSRAMLNGLPAAIGLPVKVLLYRGYAGNIHATDPIAYLKYLHPRADGVICITEEIKALVDRENWYRQPLAVCIPKGHDPAWYADVNPADLKAYGIPPEAFTVACMANNRAFKDIPTLLRAWVRLEGRPDIHLLLIGRDMDHPANRLILKGTPAFRQVHFAGYFPDPLPLLKASQVIALSSTKGEAITKSVLEGMSLGLAPVITNIPGNRHLVKDGVSGLLVPPGDPAAFAGAVQQLADDRSLCQRMGQEARRFMQTEMHIDRTIDLTLAWYARWHSGAGPQDGRHAR